MGHEPEWNSDDVMMRTERTEIIDCPACDGYGRIEGFVQLPTPSWALEPRYADVDEDCGECLGSGKIEVVRCLVCGKRRDDDARGDEACRCDEDEMTDWLAARGEAIV